MTFAQRARGGAAKRGDALLGAGIGAGLLLLVWAVFGQTLRHEFFNFDDDQGVYRSAEVAAGLSLRSVRWAFTHAVLGHWDPLTTLTHLVDVQCFGFEPWGHHLGNVILHGLAAVLLFFACRRMTGCVWRSAATAAIFAIHPLRAESVAWVTERKDVLSGVFFMLILLAYAGYARRPSFGRYLGLLALFGLGLMAKSMLVTTPLVLLLLDFWPLGRLRSGWRVVWEKLPLLALSLLSAVLQVRAAWEGIASLSHLPLLARIENALVACVLYLRDFFWPARLAVVYPHPGESLGHGEAAAALAVLVLISLAVGWRAGRQPYLAVGWLWFIGMLSPVIGIVQSGDIARADRYTYLPEIGITIAVVWLVGEWVAARSLRPVAVAAPAFLALAVLGRQAWVQTSYWKTSESLWGRTIECTTRNAVAHSNLGVYLLDHGRLEEAAPELLAALAITPGRPETEFSLGALLVRKNRPDEAIRHFQTGLRGRPRDCAARNNLGLLLAAGGRLDEAIAEYGKALEFEPGNAGVRDNLATALLQQGRLQEALAQDEKAAELAPGNGDFQNGMGLALERMGRFSEAIAHYRRALALKPGDANTENNLAWLLATAPLASVRNGPEAVALAEDASARTRGSDALLLATLAAAYAEAGRFPEALQTAQRSLPLAGAQADAALTETLRAAIEDYRHGRAFRDAALGAAAQP